MRTLVTARHGADGTENVTPPSSACQRAWHQGRWRRSLLGVQPQGPSPFGCTAASQRVASSVSTGGPTLPCCVTLNRSARRPGCVATPSLSHAPRSPFGFPAWLCHGGWLRGGGPAALAAPASACPGRLVLRSLLCSHSLVCLSLPLPASGPFPSESHLPPPGGCPRAPSSPLCSALPSVRLQSASRVCFSPGTVSVSPAGSSSPLKKTGGSFNKRALLPGPPRRSRGGLTLPPRGPASPGAAFGSRSFCTSRFPCAR